MLSGSVLQLAISVGGFALITLWGVQLWEIRQLRADNKTMVLAIGKLTAAAFESIMAAIKTACSAL